jgi:hypothetical protein
MQDVAGPDLTAGYDPQLDYPLPGRPEVAGMRESVSMWFFDDRGRIGFPRFCIEALAAQWNDRGVQANIALADGRALRCAGGFAAGAPKRVAGRIVSLDAGPLRFELVEPLRRWRLSFDGEAGESSALAQFGGAPPGASRRVRVELDAEMAAPPWSSGEAAADRATSLTIGAVAGHRHEQLFRCRGSFRLDDEPAIDFTGTGLRIRRYGMRDNGVFPGHCWQSAIFPSGRAFGLIALPPRPGRAAGFSECYVFDGRRKHAGKVVDAPWMTEFVPDGDKIDVVLETGEGRELIAGTSCLSTAFAPNASLFGGWTENGAPRRLGPLPLQQSGALYHWRGEQAYGMIERSYPSATLPSPGQ